LFELSKRIPVYLVDQTKFNEINLDDSRHDSVKPHTELLGYYVKNEKYGNEEIYLCTDAFLKQ